MVIHLMCNVSGDVLVVNTIAAPVLITVDFNMASELKYDKHIFKSLKDVCEFMVCLCDSKSAHHEGVSSMTTTSSGKQVNSNFLGGNDRRGTWVNYEMLGGIGGPVNLNQIVAIAYLLCNYIWPLYEKLSLSIEELIMYHLQPKSDDEGDSAVAVQEVLEDGADGEAYLRRMYLTLRDQGMVSANKCVLSGFLVVVNSVCMGACGFVFFCSSQCTMGIMPTCC